MNQLMRFEDLREWLMSQIDGSEETRGDDGLISDFIRQIDALPSGIAEPKGCPTPGACSCPGSIPDSIVERATVETPRTDAATVRMERLDGDIDEGLPDVRTGQTSADYTCSPTRGE
jgi:hypothetical protein